MKPSNQLIESLMSGTSKIQHIGGSTGLIPFDQMQLIGNNAVFYYQGNPMFSFTEEGTFDIVGCAKFTLTSA